MSVYEFVSQDPVFVLFLLFLAVVVLLAVSRLGEIECNLPPSMSNLMTDPEANLSAIFMGIAAGDPDEPSVPPTDVPSLPSGDGELDVTGEEPTGETHFGNPEPDDPPPPHAEDTNDLDTDDSAIECPEA